MNRIMADIQEMLQYNRLGLIPGPHESVEDFIKRASYCLNLRLQINQELQANLGEEASEFSLIAPGLAKVHDAYDIAPEWIPVFYSNYRLGFWHGGCAWIFQTSNDQPLGSLLQLRQQFKTSENYLGMYHRNELTAHELSHVGRMAFEEPQFEEFFAYRTATSSFRRWLGPIVQSSVESMLVLILIGLFLFVDIFLIVFGEGPNHSTLWWKLLPFGLLVTAGLLRLWRRHQCLSSSLNVLDQCLGGEKKALAVAYRLQDKEIKAFAKMTPSEIKAYAKEQAAHSLRWQVIYSAYFI